MYKRLIQIIVILLISSEVFAEGPFDSIVSAIRIAAEQGDPDAQYILGRSYCYGEDVPLDKQEGIQWLQKAVEQNHALAQYELSFWYSFGGPKENLESIELLKKAAYQDIPEAQYSLYCFYSRGRAFITTIRNMPEALKWLYKAAENNCVEAQYELANL